MVDGVAVPGEPAVPTALTMGPQEIVKKIRKATSHCADGLKWSQMEPPGAGDLSDSGRLSRSTGIWETDGISEDKWPSVRAAILEVAAAAGMHTVEILRDGPADHVLWIHGPENSLLRVLVGKRTVISMRSEAPVS